MSPTPVSLGIDGARRGWVAVRWDGTGVDAALHADLGSVLAWAERVDAVCIDMPIGLVEGPLRPADVHARAVLGPRRSSIFAAPAAGALQFGDDDYAGANAWSKAHHGRGISKQAWNLVPRIREARALDAAQPGVLVESSPELGFVALAGGPMLHPKTTWTGLMTRIALLAGAGIELPSDPGEAGRAAPDDVVDAAALAWSAMRLATGDAVVLVDEPAPVVY